MQLKYWLYLAAHLILVLLGAFLISVSVHEPLAMPQAVTDGIGASLIAAGISGMVVFTYIFTSSRFADRLTLLEASGIQAVFASRSVSIRSEYTKRLDAATNSIDIIGFGLSALREDFAQDFQRWSQRAKVRILLLDPEFPSKDYNLADIRDVEENSRRGSIRDDVLEFARALTLLRDNQRFQVRLYSAIPAVNYFRIDDEAFWGPYLMGRPSRNTPTFLLTSGTLLTALRTHFDTLWEDPKFSHPMPSAWIPT